MMAEEQGSRRAYDKRAVLEKVLRGKPGVGFEVADGLLTVAQLLGGQPVLFRRLYLAYWRREEVFEHKPRIGTVLRVGFDWDNRLVKLERLGQCFELSCEQFLVFMGIIDACCSEIYPVGTVVELDVEMMPESVQGMFKDNEPGALVSLSGRKIPLAGAGDGYVMDYLAWLWPFGQLPDSDPITVSAMMIKRVVAGGLTNEWEERFAAQVLRRRQLSPLRLSTAFMPVEMLSARP